jgi:Leucine-rich repeat (LRR) protein
MNKLLLILIALPMIGFGQQTYIPDDNFEQKLINLGLDNILDDYVGNIYNTTSLSLFSINISDLTGIEGFVNIHTLAANDNQLTNLDLSNNINLTQVFLTNNELDYLNVSTLVSLTRLECNYNNLTSIDLSNNILLEKLRI